MKFLVDNNLSPRIATGLCAADHDAVHVRDLQMQSAPDSAVLSKAREENRTLISRDVDFSRVLAFGRWTTPSLILLRKVPKRSETVLQLLLYALPSLDQAICEGSLIVIEPLRVRVRRLPLPG